MITDPMPPLFWPLLTATAFLVAGGCLFLYHAVSRRLKKLERNLRRELAREPTAGTSDLSRLARETERQSKETREMSANWERLVALNLEKFAVSHHEGQAHLAGELSRISRETPVLRQMSYRFGQNEIHAVVSFPKTGGTTLVATLADLFPEKFMPSNPFHTHLLAPPSQSLASFFEGILAFTPDTPGTSHDDMFPTGWDKKLEVGHSHRLLLRERGCVPLDRARPNPAAVRRRHPARVINYVLTTRDPVAACVSFLFQFVSTWRRWEDLSDEALLRYLESPASPPLIPSAPGCPWPLMQEVCWREQIEQVFGLDFLSLDFDRDRGWQIYDFGDVRFLVVRLENFGALPQALGAFYDLPPQRIHVLNSNIGEAKGEHGSRYRDFRSRVKIPPDLLDLAYSSRFAGHFYSAAELDEFRSRWSSAA